MERNDNRKQKMKANEMEKNKYPYSQLKSGTMKALKSLENICNNTTN